MNRISILDTPQPTHYTEKCGGSFWRGYEHRTIQKI